MQKRHYNKGFFIDIKENVIASAENNELGTILYSNSNYSNFEDKNSYLIVEKNESPQINIDQNTLSNTEEKGSKIKISQKKKRKENKVFSPLKYEPQPNNAKRYFIKSLFNSILHFSVYFFLQFLYYGPEIMAIVGSVYSIVAFILVGIFSYFLLKKSRAIITEAKKTKLGRGYAIAGMILSIINLSLIAIVFLGVLMLLFIAATIA